MKDFAKYFPEILRDYKSMTGPNGGGVGDSSHNKIAPLEFKNSIAKRKV